MSERWHYQLNGFELGPVPASEIRRLLQKGRLAPDSPVRPEGGGPWATAEQLGGSEPGDATESATAPESTAPRVLTVAAAKHLGLFDRAVPVLVPLAVGLMAPWESTRWSAGAVLLGVAAGALIRVLFNAAGDLAAIRAGLRAKVEPGAVRR